MVDHCCQSWRWAWILVTECWTCVLLLGESLFWCCRHSFQVHTPCKISQLLGYECNSSLNDGSLVKWSLTQLHMIFLNRVVLMLNVVIFFSFKWQTSTSLLLSLCTMGKNLSLWTEFHSLHWVGDSLPPLIRHISNHWVKILCYKFCCNNEYIINFSV